MKLAFVASALMFCASPIIAQDGRWDGGTAWFSASPLVVSAAYGGSGNGNGNGNGNTGSGNGNGNGNGNAGSNNGNGNGNDNSGSDNGNRNGNNNAGSGFGNGLGNGNNGSGFGNDTGNGVDPGAPSPTGLATDYDGANSSGLPSAQEGSIAPWEALWLELTGRSELPSPLIGPPDGSVNSLY